MRLTTDGVHCTVCGHYVMSCPHNCGQLKAVGMSGRCLECIERDALKMLENLHA